MSELVFSDSQAVDAFGRLRVGSHFTLFNNIQHTPSSSIVWATRFTSGATATYNASRASTSLDVTGVSGSSAIRQSRRYMSYQPGKSQLIMFTAIVGSTSASIIKRLGYFDEMNGIFFEMSGSAPGWVIRSSVSGRAVDSRIEQEDWNTDTFGALAGKSNTALDFCKNQLFVIDFTWLGTGRVRCGFFIGGSIKYAHLINFSNTLTSVFMTSPILPLRFEIHNSGSATGDRLEQICSMVSTEGGEEPIGKLRSIDRQTSPLKNVSANLVPLLSLRRAIERKDVNVTIKRMTIMAAPSGPTSLINYVGFRWTLMLNPTVGNDDGAKWTPIVNSNMQFDISRTTSNVLSGSLLKSGYADPNERTVVVDLHDLPEFGFDISTGAQDEIVLGVQQLTSGTMNFYGGIVWNEH